MNRAGKRNAALTDMAAAAGCLSIASGLGPRLITSNRAPRDFRPGPSQQAINGLRENAMTVPNLDAMKGAFAPLVVPFQQGEVDYDSYARICEWQIAKGSHGLLVNATCA
jgi:hypothetical protein